MSKTTQANKVKATKKKLAVEETPVVETEARNAETVTPEVAVEENSTISAEGGSASGGKKTSRVRGKKYVAARKKYDINKLYPLSEAIELVKKTSLSKFDGKIEAHVLGQDMGNIGEIIFPHFELASKKIVILNDAILAEIKDGKVNFDILIATTVTMPKLLPFAKLLGPRGLMPNPKNGTLTDKPEEAIKRLSVAKTMIKSEKKAPVIHQTVGKVSQDTKEILANINELIKVIKPVKIKKLVLCATMGPGIKCVVEK
jgi:large subunit ribosomal protein L1